MTHRLAALALALSVGLAPSPTHAAPGPGVDPATSLEGAEAPAAGSAVGVRDLPFADAVTGKGDLSLVGLRVGRYVTFGIPDAWRLVGQPELVLDVVRSGLLLPEASRVTVSVDGQVVGDFALDGPAGGVDHVRMDLPGGLTPGVHTLQFDAVHRSALPCELAEHPGLWSRILATSYVRVRHRVAAPAPRLSSWPAPFVDARDPFPSRVALALPKSPSIEEIQAAGYVASALGAATGGGRLDLVVFQGAPEDAPAGDVVAIGRADGAAGAAVTRLLARGNADVAALGKALATDRPASTGALALVPRPGRPEEAVLVVTATDAAGLLNAARALGPAGATRLPRAAAARIEPEDAPAPDARRWRGFAPPEATFTLADLGLEDMTAQGPRGGAVAFPLPLVPDERPGPDATLRLVYSFAEGADPRRSRVDVLVDGVGVGGTTLEAPEGGAVVLKLPPDVGPDTRVEVRFDLAPKEEPACLGDAAPPLWGTVHADSRVELPRERRPRRNDLAELRHGAFPFGLRPDLGETLFVLPATPDGDALQLYAWLAGELGRVAPGDGFAYGVRTGALRSAADQDRDLVVVDAGPSTKLLATLQILPALQLGRRAPGTTVGSGARVALAQDPGVAWFEALPLPWNAARTALVAHATDGAAFVRVGPGPGRPPLLDRLGGRVSRVDEAGGVVAVAPASPSEGAAPAATSAAPTRPALALVLPGVGLAAALLGFGLRARLGVARHDTPGGR